MRKQQWEIARGGVPHRRSTDICTSNGPPGSCGTALIPASHSTGTSARAGTEGGWKWSGVPCEAWQWAWHSAGCWSSMDRDMDSAQGMPDSVICATSSALAAPSHAYCAKAVWANNTAHSESITVSRRQEERLDVSVRKASTGRSLRH